MVRHAFDNSIDWIAQLIIAHTILLDDTNYIDIGSRNSLLANCKTACRQVVNILLSHYSFLLLNQMTQF